MRPLNGDALAQAQARLLAEEWGLCSSTESVFADLGSGVGKLVASWPALLPGYLNFFGGLGLAGVWAGNPRTIFSRLAFALSVQASHAMCSFFF